MSGRLVVKRYVKALVLAADEADILDNAVEDIAVISGILGEKEIRNFCFRNQNTASAMEFVKTAFLPYVSEYTGRWLQIMAGNGRLAALPLAESAFKELMEQRSNTVSVLLESAHKPDEQLEKSIVEKMEKKLGKRVVLNTVVNRALLGGFRIIWQNRIMDRSVKGRLNNLKTALK